MMNNYKEDFFNDLNTQAESSAGVHFYGLYQQCPKKFFYKYLAEVQSTTTPAALLNGKIIHKMTEEAYKGIDLELILNTTKDYLNSIKNNYPSQEDYLDASYKLEPMFKLWYETYLMDDLHKYEVLETEVQHKVVLPSGFTLTIRPDRILKNKTTKECCIMDTKTSSWGMVTPYETMLAEQQATAYIYGARLTYPNENIIGVVTDVLYARKNAKGYNIEVFRSPVIQRTDYQITEWIFNVSSLIDDITSRVEDLSTGTPYEALFPRPMLYPPCAKFKCEYASICSRPLSDELLQQQNFTKKQPLHKLIFSPFQDYKMTMEYLTKRPQSTIKESL